VEEGQGIVTDICVVLDTWGTEGPLIHEPTGFAKLDEATGGGPVYGTRWVVVGAPDAGKTALLVQIGHEYAKRGIHVGFLAVDEEAGDLVTRLAQRVGFSRQDCERRDPEMLAKMSEVRIPANVTASIGAS
jgi:predicted ATP-dependent serine protease